MQHKRNRTSLRKPSGTRQAPDISADHKPSSVDVWLSRGSHIAQLGLFGLTLAALYYTVIPLYKTAALEEQIARREAELKVAEMKVAAAETALQDAKTRTYRRDRAELVWNLNMRGPLNCTSLWRQPKLADKSKGESTTPLLSINVADCMIGEVNQLNPQAVLSPDDWAFLQQEVERAGAQLEARRAEALANIRALELKSDDELKALAPSDSFTRRLDDRRAEQERQYPGLVPRTSLRRNYLNLAQLQVVSEFEEAVREEFVKLRKVTWPQPRASDSALQK